MNTNVSDSDIFPLSEKLFIALLSLSPLFLLTVAHWINGIVFLISSLSIYFLVSNKIKGFDLIPRDISLSWTLLLAAVFISPLAAVFLGQCIRQEFSWPNYDSPSRFLLCLPILFVIVLRQINIRILINYSIPGATLITLTAVSVSPNTFYGTERLTTYFVDPLTFGSLSLTLGLFSLVSIDAYNKDSLSLKIYKLLGGGAGVYLSVMSGSRTGWLALPLVIFLWFQFKGARHKFTTLALTAGISLIFSLTFYYSIPVVQKRVNLFINEALDYRWNSMNPETSTAERISFYRIGFSLFTQKPFGGWGDTSFANAMNTSDIVRFASQNTLIGVKNCGFHNEILTNTVRSGIWGLLSSSIIFLVPGLLFIKGIRSKSTPIRRLALLGCCYLVCTFISGMSTEVFNLKFTATFHALMITCLTGSILTSIRSSSGSESPTATRAIDSGPETLPERPDN